MPQTWKLRGGYFLFALAFGSSSGLIASAAGQVLIDAQKVATGLRNPRSAAIRPDGAGEQYEVFVAESGAGRVVKFTNSKPGKSTDSIAGFAIPSSTEKGVGPSGVLSLQFIDHIRLAVVGSDDDEQPFVRLFELPESDAPLTADQHKADISIPVADKKSRPNPLIFPGITRTQPNEKVGDSLLIPAWTDPDSGGLFAIPVRAGTLSQAVPIRLMGGVSDVDVGAMAVAKSGYVVVVGHTSTKPDDASVMEFFNPLDRRIVMQVAIDLAQITALAYHPKTGNLYAANSTDENHAGIYRIDATGEAGASACTAVKVANVQRPTALAFGPDGLLYVTSLGDSKDANANGGMLVKLVGTL